MTKNINPAERFLSAWKKKITGKTFRISLLWSFGFFSVMLFFYEFIRFEWFIIAIVYFLFLSFVMMLSQSKTYKQAFRKIGTWECLAILCILGVHVTTALVGQKLLWEWNVQSSVSFLNFDNYFLYVKPFDVFFQQMIIIWLIYTLRINFSVLAKIIGILIVIFGLSHSILIYFMGLFWGIYFTSFAVLWAIIFPLLITRFRNGWIMTYALHIWFYSFSGMIVLMKSHNLF